MRIALLYPPPWKIRGPGEGAGERDPDGPPDEYMDGDLDADFFQTPYGLFALGAQAMRAGHQVKVMNLSGFTWTRVEEVLRALDADLYGMSCWTANRRGVALVAQEIKRLHPRAHVVVGGPHATPLAREMLAHHPDIDSVCIGESELTFLELRRPPAARAGDAGASPGMAYRAGGRVEIAPERPALEELDSLASPHDYFDTHIVMTSRGCPWRCTFCGAETSWGRGFRGPVGAVRARRAREGRGARAREDDPDQGRHLHDEQEARRRALPRHPRARTCASSGAATRASTSWATSSSARCASPGASA